MRIAKMHIENFRSLRDFSLVPESGVNLIVGENNAGKSALLVALSRTLGRGTPEFDVEDFYVTQASTHVSALPVIRIDLEFRPPTGAQFTTNFIADFVDAIDIDGTVQPFLTLRTEAHFDNVEDRVVVEYLSVRLDGSTKRVLPGKRFTLRGYVPFYLVDAFRDTVRDLQGRRSFWGRIVSSVNLDAVTVSSIQTALAGINSTILAAAPRIGDLEQRLREIGKTIPTVSAPDDIVINPLTVDPASILHNLEVVLRTEAAPRGFGLERHGEGTRSVAHLAIFRAFIELIAKEENDNVESTPILGIEEPEVHLHPHATRSIGRVLSSPDRQIFLTTHSPTLTQTMDFTSIRLLRRDVSGSHASHVPLQNPNHPGSPFFEARERSQLDKALRSGAAEIFFSRVVLVCEGKSELQAYPYFASALGIEMDKLGLSLVAVDCDNFYPLLKMMGADALRIPWVVTADGDILPKLASQLVKLGLVTQSSVSAAELSSTIDSAILQPHDVFTLPNEYNLEEFLIRTVAASEYQQAIVNYIGSDAVSRFVSNDPTMANMSLEDQLVAFMKTKSGSRWKVLLAGVVAEQITGRGTSNIRVPPTITRVLQRLSDFGTGAATKYF